MTPDLLSRSLKLLRRRQFFIWLGLGMSLSGLFGTGWRVWLAQIFTFDFAQLSNLQSVESLLFSSELVQMQQLLLRGLLLVFGQFVLVWLVALLAEAGIITAVSHHHPQPITLRQTIRWGRQWLARFLVIDLLVFFPWFLIALLMMILVLVLALVLASFAVSQPSAGVVFATTGLGLTCLLGLALLLLPVGLASLWYRLLAFREAVLHGVDGRTAVRQTWQRIRHNLGDVFVLIIVLWGGPTFAAGWDQPGHFTAAHLADLPHRGGHSGAASGGLAGRGFRDAAGLAGARHRHRFCGHRLDRGLPKFK